MTSLYGGKPASFILFSPGLAPGNEGLYNRIYDFFLYQIPCGKPEKMTPLKGQKRLLFVTPDTNISMA